MRKVWSLFTCLLVLASWSIGYATPPTSPEGSQDTARDQTILPADILTDIQVAGREVHLVFKLSDSTWRTYTALEVTDPSRVIVDLPNTTADGIPPSWTVENGLITKIETVTIHPTLQPYTRVVIELTRETSYTIERVEEKILVTFEQSPDGTGVSSALVRARPEPPTAEPVPQKPEARSQAAGEETLPSAGRLLTLQASETGQEADFLIVGDGRLDKYRAFDLTDPPRVVVDLRDVQSSGVKDALTLSGSLVKRVRVGLHPDKVRLVFDLIPEVGVSYKVISGGDTLQVVFRPDSGVGK